MSQLVVRRKKALWQARIRDYIVLVDGLEVARVANGTEVAVHIKPGEHIVTMKIDWCRSKPLPVRVHDGQTVVLECGPNSSPWLALLYVTILCQRYVWLRGPSVSSAT